MVKLHRIVALVLVLVVCPIIIIINVGENSHLPEEYILEYEISGNTKIMQLTDTHINNEGSKQNATRFIKKMFDANLPDIIVFTGDIFQGGIMPSGIMKSIIVDFFEFVDGLGAKWCYVFGNHDDETGVSRTEIGKIVASCENSLFLNVYDNIKGSSNYVVNLCSDNNIISSLFMFDSNSYRTYGLFYSGYDYIYPNQISWYEKCVKYISEKQFGTYNVVDNKVVPSLAFFHIPFPEYQLAYDLYALGEIAGSGEANERVGSPKHNTGLFDKMKQLGSTKGVFAGHEHVNNFSIMYQGISLNYGVKSNTGSYYDINKLGCRMIEINEMGEFNTWSYFTKFDI